MPDDSPTPTGPPLGDSVARALEAGQRLVHDRVDLLRFDLRQLARRTLSSALLIAAGGFLVAVAWVALMGAAVLWLQAYLSPAASLAAMAAATAGLGAAAMAIGVQRGGLGTVGDVGASARARSPEIRGAEHEALQP